MAPRFVEIKVIPRDNETVGAVLESFGTECYEKIESTMDTIRNTNWTNWSIEWSSDLEWPLEWPVEWPVEWTVELPKGWSVELPSVSWIPRSSILCFSLAFVCLCVYSCMSIYLSRREWRRLCRVYET